MGFYTAKENFVGYDSNGKKYLLVHFICDTVGDLPAYDLYSSNGYIIQMGSTADIITGAKKYQLQSNGLWADITQNNGVYTLPAASASSLGGIIVGSGLSIDSNGVLSSSGGASMPYTNHNGGIRGNNLGSSYTVEQKAAIAAGTFEDIYVGDYWELNGKKYRVADIDTFYLQGNPQESNHHVVIMPDELSSSGYNIDNIHYGLSNLCTSVLPSLASGFEIDFGGTYLVNHNFVVDRGGTNQEWIALKAMIPSIHNIFGGVTVTPPGETWESRQPNQFALFRYKPEFIATQNSSVNFWCIEANSGNDSYIAVTRTRAFNWYQRYSYTNYIRPFFLLAGTSQ